MAKVYQKKAVKKYCRFYCRFIRVLGIEI